MSPAIKQLVEEMKAVKDHYENRKGSKLAPANKNGPVGMDVIERLVAAILAQDEDIEKLKHKTRNMTDDD
jgi:hypothetical protein